MEEKLAFHRNGRPGRSYVHDEIYSEERQGKAGIDAWRVELFHKACLPDDGWGVTYTLRGDDMSLENQELACVQAFLEDRASEQLMTRLLADAGEDYAWFRLLAQHMFRSHLSPDEQRELLEAAKADTQGDPEKIQAAHDARLLLLKSGMCLSIHESWYLHKVKQMPLEKAFRQTMTRIVVGFGQLMSEPSIPNDFEMQLWYRIQG